MVTMRNNKRLIGSEGQKKKLSRKKKKEKARNSTMGLCSGATDANHQSVSPD
jgi:hypothetical protein